MEVVGEPLTVTGAERLWLVKVTGADRHGRQPWVFWGWRGGRRAAEEGDRKGGQTKNAQSQHTWPRLQTSSDSPGTGFSCGAPLAFVLDCGGVENLGKISGNFRDFLWIVVAWRTWVKFPRVFGDFSVDCGAWRTTTASSGGTAAYAGFGYTYKEKPSEISRNFRDFLDFWEYFKHKLMK